MLYWPVVALRFGSDLVRTMAAEQLSPAVLALHAFVLVATAVLTVMQQYWGYLILCKLGEKVRGEKARDE